MNIFHKDGDDDGGRKNNPRGDKGGRGPQLPSPPGRPFRTMMFWALVLLLALTAYKMYAGNLLTTQRIDIPYTRFVQELEKGNIERATFVEETRTVLGDLHAEASETVAGRSVSIKSFKTNFLGDGALLADKARQANPNAQIMVQAPGINWLSVLFTWLPLLLFLVAWMFMLRQMQGGGSAAMRFGKSKAKVLMESQTRVTFKDVAGCDEAKQELQEIIEFLKEPQKFQRLGGRIPKGALLLGPPGSGKTLLAKAVAGEAGVPFFSMSGSDFVEMFVGVGASVTGDTPILVRDTQGTRLVPIGEYVDGFYTGDAAGFPIRVDGVQTLGFDKQVSASTKAFVKGSAWKPAAAVYRHRVTEIHEIRYQGGTLRTTGDHSVFVRTRDGVKAVEARELKPGDVLVELPLTSQHTTDSAGSVAGNARFEGTPMLLLFDGVSQPDVAVLASSTEPTSSGGLSLATSTAASHTVLLADTMPVALPEDVAITPALLKLAGYHAAAGVPSDALRFELPGDATDLHTEVSTLLRDVFGVNAEISASPSGTVDVVVRSVELGKFFGRLNGGQSPRHIPEILWSLPVGAYQAYLTGFALGAGWALGGSASHHDHASIIRELTWLASMHGVSAVGTSTTALAVESVVVKPYDGFVYDLCGCENEAFFGGDKPVLLHNSRVRDLFEQGKRNAPCLTGDTRITLTGGREITIGEMFDSRMTGVKVPSMTSDFRIQDVTVIGITRKPSPNLFQIRTSTSAIKATGNHEFPIWRGDRMEWVRTDALQTGDYVATPRVVPTTPFAPKFTSLLAMEDVLVHWPGETREARRPRLHEVLDEVHRRHGEGVSLSVGRGGWGSSHLERFPLEVTEDMAYLGGLIASDGCFGERGHSTITFSNTEPALHDRLSDILKYEFGYTPRLHKNKKYFDTVLPQGGHPKTLRDSWTTHINHRFLCDVLRRFDERIQELPAFLVAAWLRGVFDGDGCVRTTPSCPQVILSAWQGRNNQQIRSALIRLGISVPLSASSHAGRDGNIVISGVVAIRSFIDKVYSDHPAKRASLDTISALIADRATSSSRLDTIPVGGALRAARESLGMGQRAFSRGHVVSAYERGLNNPSRSSLQSVVEEMAAWSEARGVTATEELGRVRELTESAVLWSRIEAVDSVEAGEHVYDLCLDMNHNFVANEIFTKNCILFIDEIDAVGRHRGAGLGGGHDEREQTLNQLLVEMDGFESNEGVIMIAATNRPDVLDPALMRPGRFDRQIVVDWPDVRGREGILKVHTRKLPLGEDVDLKLIARETPGMSGADLANIANEAALLAARRNHKKISLRDFGDAKDKVTFGLERRSLVMTEVERRTTAYHEAGHALVAWLIPGSDPVSKITIIPRGRALGLTGFAPSEERHTISKKQLEDRLSMMMGGRAAELLVFEHLTTGAGNDLERATAAAHKMVTQFGMSDKLGPLSFGKGEEMMFLGREISRSKDYSEATAVLIDSEIRSIVEMAHAKALQLLKDNLDKLHLLANTLLERETIDGDQMDRVLRGETLEPAPRYADLDAPPPSASAPVTRTDEGGAPEGFGEPSPRPA